MKMKEIEWKGMKEGEGDRHTLIGSSHQKTEKKVAKLTENTTQKAADTKLLTPILLKLTWLPADGAI